MGRRVSTAKDVAERMPCLEVKSRHNYFLLIHIVFPTLQFRRQLPTNALPQVFIQRLHRLSYERKIPR